MPLKRNERPRTVISKKLKVLCVTVTGMKFMHKSLLTRLKPTDNPKDEVNARIAFLRETIGPYVTAGKLPSGQNLYDLELLYNNYFVSNTYIGKRFL